MSISDDPSKQTTANEARVQRLAELNDQLIMKNTRLRTALIEIERLSPRPGGVGQIARDTLRICK